MSAEQQSNSDYKIPPENMGKRERKLWDRYERTKKPRHHPDVVEGRCARFRTALNAAITAGDSTLTSAGFGDAASLAADGFKAVNNTGKFFGKNLHLDSTPDVPLWKAVVSEGIEIPTVGAFPTHAIESYLQLRHDLPRMKKAKEVKKELKQIQRAQRLASKKQSFGKGM